MTLEQLAKQIGAEVAGDAGAEVTSCATLDQAKAGQVSFLANPKYLKQLETTQATAAVVGLNVSLERKGLTLLKAKDPYYTFMKAVVALHGYRKHPHTGVHPMAYVDATAKVGEGTVVYPGAFVGPGAKVGRDCILYPNAVVYDGCVLGDRVTVHAGAAIGVDGFGYATQEGVHHKIPQTGNVVLEDDVEIGANCAIQRATLGSTIIGKGTKFGDLIDIGHGTKIGPHALFVGLVGIAGSVTIGHHCTIAGQAGMAGHLKLGDNVTIGAQAGVMESLEDKATVFGAPAMPASTARRVYSLFVQLPELVGRIKELEKKLAELEAGNAAKEIGPAVHRGPAAAYNAGMADTALPAKDVIAFPKLDAADLAALRPLASCCSFKDGEVIFRAGDADMDLFVVESGGIEVLNPSDGDKHVVTHGPGEFAGDIDLLTRRPVIVTGIAKGPTRLMRVPGARLREILNKVPRLSEKMLIACQERRRLLSEAGVLGLRVVGPGKCRDTTLVREFLFKNFVPFTWYDSASENGHKLMEKWGSPKKSPVIECGDGRLLINPGLRDLAQSAGVWRHCPVEEVDLAIVGAGPAGMTAAVYAASEGVSTVVLDRLGPGGQAAGSSKIENFIGFPSGLSGADLAMRSVLQMLKFGARMVAPVVVEKIEPAKDWHLLHLDCGTKLRARTVLVSAGVAWRKLEAAGAERFEGAGIHYACTSVEAMLFDNQDVAVVGAGNSAGQAAMFLAECCRDRRVHLLVRKKLGPGMSDYLVGRIRAAANITVHEGVEVSEVHGERRLEGVTLRAFQGETTGPSEELAVAAMFVFIGAEPGCRWLPQGVARDALGYVLTGVDAMKSGKWPLSEREPCPLETTVPGILAAGDIRSGSTKRVGFAVGDGSLAVTCVHKLTAIRS